MNQNPFVQFYLVDKPHAQQAAYFACQLIEKFYQESRDKQDKKAIYVHVKSAEEANRFDALLWTYRDDSFLPHQLYRPHSPSEVLPPIQIGYQETPINQNDILVNLTSEVPLFYKQFKQVIEIVFEDVSVQQLARKRYKLYRDDACEITTHKIKM